MRPIGVVAAFCAGLLAVAGCGGSAGSDEPGQSGSSTAAITSEPAWPVPADADLPQSTIDDLQAELARYVGDHDLVGATASVVTRDGAWAGAAGTDGSGTTLEAASAMEIASTTKTFVAAEVLLLSQEGRIDLDAPVTDYVTVPFDTGGATVRQLATMTSAFPDLPETVIRAQVSADLSKQWSCSDVVALVAPDAPRAGALGGAVAYNGLNYYVLGMVIEKVTGQPLAVALREDLLTPTGLDRVWTQTGTAPEAPQPPLARPVDDTTNPVVDADSAFLPSTAAATSSCGGAGMAADAASLARWGYLLYGGHIIDGTLVTVMTTPNPQGGGAIGQYGFGTMISNEGGDPLWGHAGNYVQYTSILLVWPSSATSVAVLVPMTGGADNDVRADLAGMLAQIVQPAG